MRYFIAFSYDGTSFFGYQKQPQQISVQEVLERGLSLLLGEKIAIVGAGRTDAGVHALRMYAHFQCVTDFDLKHMVHRLNAFLPVSIGVSQIFKVKENLHARFDAISRTYHYQISLKKNPFLEHQAWQLWKNSLDVEQMARASQILLQYDDFTSFAKLHTDNKTNFCKIFHAFWKEENDLLRFEIKANRFLRNMVRSIVGTLVEVGLGKRKAKDMHSIIEGKNRGLAAGSAPAKGLFLADVEYEFF